jgi:hypothetical protein
MSEKRNKFFDFLEGRNFPPIPALAVVLDFSDSTVRSRLHRKTLWQKAESLCGEDFKVRALLRIFLKNFRNFVPPEKMAF